MALLNFSGKLQLFADDGVLMYTSETIENLYSQMNADLSILHSWCNVNHMILNNEKTKYIVFENSSSNTDALNFLEITYNNLVIERVNNYSYLGLIINSKFIWDNHIYSLKRSIIPYIFAIGRARHLLPRKSLLMIYNAFIQSRLVYLNPIWSGSPKNKLLEIEILQKRVLK